MESWFLIKMSQEILAVLICTFLDEFDFAHADRLQERKKLLRMSFWLDKDKYAQTYLTYIFPKTQEKA